MANFHPTDNTLAEFSAGSLDWALGIPVSAHLELCPECQRKVTEYNSVGGSILEHAKPVDLTENSFDQLMQRIKTGAASSASEPQNANDNNTAENPMDKRTRALPKVIRKLILNNEPIKWSSVTGKLKSAQVVSGQEKYEVSFHKIKQGGKVAEHDHCGLEITLVLEGSFSDADGNYNIGDYLVKKPGEIHRPIAAQNQDCLCLSILEAPVKLTGFFGKIINPFLSISPR